MFLEITTTHTPATDLGFLLHKNPGRLHQKELTFGSAWLCFPEASDARCTAALMLDIDTVALVRGKTGSGGLMQQYVNDRPYVASSFLSVAMGRMIPEAIAGRSKERQTLAETPIPLSVRVTPLPVRGGSELLQKLFEPLGHTVTCDAITMDDVRDDWGQSPYVSLTLSGVMRLCDVLSHLYVLIPVLDARKHYFVGDDELEKLLLRGEGWLKTHPERELIVTRYLKGRSSLVREALARLTEDEEPEAESAFDPAKKDTAEETIEKPLRLHDRRLDAVAEVLKRLGTNRVLDLGCGVGKLMARLVKEKQFTEIVGVEVSSVALARADAWRERLPERARERVTLLHGALIYRDARLRGFDAAALVEVIEHIEPERLHHMERAVFADAAPRFVVVTTPNADYNILFPTLTAGTFRHEDHRFEWSRAEFADWCTHIAATYGYQFAIEPLGDVDPQYGPPSQMGIFSK